MPRRPSLYAEHPEYRVDLEPNPGRACVRFNGEKIAESASAVLVRETAHEPVVYFPRKDVRLDLLESTNHETFCPFKGDASYWSLRVRDRIEENVVWSYEDPYPQVAGLKDLMAFYRDRVDWDPDV